MDTQLAQTIDVRTVTLTHDRGEHHGAEYHTFRVGVLVGSVTVFVLDVPQSFATYDEAERLAHVKTAKEFAEQIRGLMPPAKGDTQP